MAFDKLARLKVIHRRHKARVNERRGGLEDYATTVGTVEHKPEHDGDMGPQSRCATIPDGRESLTSASAATTAAAFCIQVLRATSCAHVVATARSQAGWIDRAMPPNSSRHTARWARMAARDQARWLPNDGAPGDQSRARIHAAWERLDGALPADGQCRVVTQV